MNDTQNVILKNRQALSVTGGTDVCGFDESCVSMVTTLGDLLIKGRSLRISRLSLEIGEVDLEGEVGSVEYTKLRKKHESFLARILK